MFEKFTDRARRAVAISQEEARRLGAVHIGTEHLLLGIIGTGETAELEAVGGELAGLASRLVENLRQELEEIVGPPGEPSLAHIPFTVGARNALNLAYEEAREFGQEEVQPRHLLLGLMREGNGEAAQILARRDYTLDRVREEVARNTGGSFRKYTDRAWNVVFVAHQEAQKRGAEDIGTEHLLLGLVETDIRDLKALGISPDDLSRDILEWTGPAGDPPGRGLPWGGTAKRALRLAYMEADASKPGCYVDTGHLLLGLIGLPEATAARLLTARGATEDSAREQVAPQTTRRHGGRALSCHVRPARREPGPSRRRLPAGRERTSSRSTRWGWGELGGGLRGSTDCSLRTRARTRA